MAGRVVRAFLVLWGVGLLSLIDSGLALALVTVGVAVMGNQADVASRSAALRFTLLVASLVLACLTARLLGADAGVILVPYAVALAILFGRRRSMPESPYVFAPAR